MGLPSPVPMRKDKKIIPRDELMFWVENNVNADGATIVQIRDAHLWTIGDYERHRLDVFEKHYAEGEGEFCWTCRIAASRYCLHYNPSSKTTEEKTLARYDL